MSCDDLAIADFAAPAFDLVLVEDGLGHGVATEVLKFQPRAAALSAPDVAGAFEQALRVVLHHQQDPGEVRAEPGEGHRSVDVSLCSGRLPHDVGVGDLLHRGRLPLTVRPEHLSLPGTLLVVEIDVLDLLHETREVFVLRPEVVRRAQRESDIQRLRDDGDLELLAFAATTTTAATTAAAEEA